MPLCTQEKMVRTHQTSSAIGPLFASSPPSLLLWPHESAALSLPVTHQFLTGLPDAVLFSAFNPDSALGELLHRS